MIIFFEVNKLNMNIKNFIFKFNSKSIKFLLEYTTKLKFIRTLLFLGINFYIANKNKKQGIVS